MGSMWGNITFQQSLTPHFGKGQAAPSSADWWLTTPWQLSRHQCPQPVTNSKPLEIVKMGRWGGFLSTPLHTTHPSHTDGYRSVADMWQLINLPYCSHTLGSNHAWSRSRMGLWAQQAPSDTEFPLLPFLGGDHDCSAESVSGQLRSPCLFLPLQVSSGSACLHPSSQALNGSGLKRRCARRLQVLKKDLPDQKHDRHWGSSETNTGEMSSQVPIPQTGSLVKAPDWSL